MQLISFRFCLLLGLYLLVHCGLSPSLCEAQKKAGQGSKTDQGQAQSPGNSQNCSTCDKSLCSAYLLWLPEKDTTSVSVIFCKNLDPAPIDSNNVTVVTTPGNVPLKVKSIQRDRTTNLLVQLETNCLTSICGRGLEGARLLEVDEDVDRMRGFVDAKEAA